MIQTRPDTNAFLVVKAKLEVQKDQLTIKDICDVFGWPAVELFLYHNQSEINSELIHILSEIRNKSQD